MGKEEESEPLLNASAEERKPVPVRAMVMCGVMMVLYMSGLISFSPLISQFIRHSVALTYFNSSNATANTNNFCKKNTSDENSETAIKIQQKSADLLLYFTLAGGIISIFVNLVLGSYSDFLGRRILFAVPSLGAVVKGITLCVIVGFQLPLDWFYFGYVLEGLTGGFSAFLLAVFSYTADVTQPGRGRTLMIALMEGILALAGSLGQLGLGFVIEDLSYLDAGIAVTVLFAVGLVLLIVLPETVPTSVEKHWSPIPHIKKVFGFFITRGTCKQRALYIISLMIFYFGVIASLGRNSVETLYQLDKPFCWSPLKIGYYGAIRLSVSVVFSVAALKLFQPCFRDMTIAAVGMVFGVASFLVEGLAVNDAMLYLVPVIGFVSFNAVPVARSTLSKMTSPLEQGALFSSIATMETICNMMSTSLYNSVYEATVGVFRGAVFLMMAGFGVLTAALIIVFLLLTKDDAPKYSGVIPPPTDISPLNSNAEESRIQRKIEEVEEKE